MEKRIFITAREAKTRCKKYPLRIHCLHCCLPLCLKKESIAKKRAFLKKHYVRQQLTRSKAPVTEKKIRTTFSDISSQRRDYIHTDGERKEELI